MFKDLRRYEDWCSRVISGGTQLRQYISFHLHPEDVLIMSTLYFPKFVSVGEYILFADEEDLFRASVANLDLYDQKREKSFNQMKLWEVFSEIPGEGSTIINQLAVVLERAWRLSVKDQFPDRDFIVEYVDSEHNYGPTLFVYQDRK